MKTFFKVGCISLIGIVVLLFVVVIYIFVSGDDDEVSTDTDSGSESTEAESKEKEEQEEKEEKRPEELTMPDLLGWEYAAAREEIEKLNLKTKRKSINSEEVEEGLIVKTDPQADRSLKEESTVTLFVSEGQEPEEFKDYVGENFKQVEKILKDAGYSDVIKYEKTSEKPIGEIITQIQPKAGREVVPNKTSVIFEVSQGP